LTEYSNLLEAEVEETAEATDTAAAVVKMAETAKATEMAEATEMAAVMTTAEKVGADSTSEDHWFVSSVSEVRIMCNITALSGLRVQDYSYSEARFMSPKTEI
jgi:hypothetical protein